MKRTDLQRSVLLGLLAAVLSVLFVFMGGPVLRVLFSTAKPIFYFLFGLLMTAPMIFAGMAPIGFFTLGLWMTVGAYCWFESKGHAGFWWATASVAVGIVIGALGPVAHSQWTGVELGGLLNQSVHEITKNWAGRSATQLSEEDLKQLSQLSLQLIPSFVGIVMMGALGVALIFAEKLALLMNLRYERVASQMKLAEFRVPDLVVWILLGSMLVSFVDLGIPGVKVLGFNFLILSLGAYFFQGLAVFEAGLNAFQVHPIVRLLLYVFVVAQLFFLLSVLGLADFWLDLRRRWKIYNKLSPSSEE